jgi:hypothetical protein
VYNCAKNAADTLKALLSVFKGRAVDPLREKDTDIERCEVTVEDGAGEIKSRFIVKMICRHGNTAKHLWYSKELKHHRCAQELSPYI